MCCLCDEMLSREQNAKRMIRKEGENAKIAVAEELEEGTVS